MKRTLQLTLAVACALGFARVATAGPISVYTAPDKTYQNTANNPCLFFGPGNSGCSQDPANWPAPIGDTGGGDDFNPNPLVNTFTGTDLTTFLNIVGNAFVIGFDVNDTTDPQTLSDFTISFLNASSTVLASYSFSPPTASPNTANGLGYADYVLAAGCGGTTTGSGVSATCTETVPNGPTYVPFVVPNLTATITFTFGLTDFNDGPDKIFLIPTVSPGQQCTDPNGCEHLAETPEPTTMALFGTGLLFAAAQARRRAKRA
jgi:hypothetical protein